jgi:hypothetical protein
MTEGLMLSRSAEWTKKPITPPVNIQGVFFFIEHSRSSLLSVIAALHY